MIAIGIPESAALSLGVIVKRLAIKIPDARVMYVAIHMPSIVRKLLAVI